MLHPDLARARFLPRVSLGPRLLRLVRRASVPAGPVGAGLVVEDVRLEEPAGGLRVRLYRPAELPLPTAALLWLHGGGFVLGSPEQDDRTCLAIASRLGMTVASVDYRLAPEHPFPAALDDAWAALGWLLDHSTERQIDPARIAVGGASAGGGLAAALAQRVRDQGLVELPLQVLVYPMLDDRTGAVGTPTPKDLRVWTPESNRFAWASYLRTTARDGRVPYAVPARCEHLAGLAPAWIGVGTEDLFHDEDADYARRLIEAGVPTQFTVVPGAFHGFDAAFPGQEVSRRFLDEQVAALSAALFPAA